MACCQGDTGQPGSVSFTDANETSQLPLMLASSGNTNGTPPPSPEKSSCIHLSREKRGCATIYLLFTFACYVPPLCPVCLCSFGKEGLLIISKCPITPTLMSSLLVSSSIPLIPCVELAFSEMGADSSMHCWITALRRHSTPPQRQQKGRLLCLAGGKQLGTDDAGQADLRDHSYRSDKVCYGRDKQLRGGGRQRRKAERECVRS